MGAGIYFPKGEHSQQIIVDRPFDSDLVTDETDTDDVEWAVELWEQRFLTDVRNLLPASFDWHVGERWPRRISWLGDEMLLASNGHMVLSLRQWGWGSYHLCFHPWPYDEYVSDRENAGRRNLALPYIKKLWNSFWPALYNLGYEPHWRTSGYTVAYWKPAKEEAA